MRETLRRRRNQRHPRRQGLRSTTMNVTIKQSLQEQNEIRAQLERALAPFKLDWNDAASIAMLGAYMHKHFVLDGVMDASFANCYTAVKALKQHLGWVGDVPRTAPKIASDERGNQIRDLRAERQQRAEQEAQEARERSTKKSMEDQRKDAQQNVAGNQRIESFRSEIQSVRGKTHGQTYKIREELTNALENTIAKKRNLLGMMELEDEFHRIIDRYY